jgi:hypothetical protein
VATRAAIQTESRVDEKVSHLGRSQELVMMLLVM